MRRRTFHAALGLVVGTAACSTPETTHSPEQPNDGGVNWLDLGPEAGSPSALSSSNESSNATKPRPSESDAAVPKPHGSSEAPSPSTHGGDAATHDNTTHGGDATTHGNTTDAPPRPVPSDGGSNAGPTSSAADSAASSNDGATNAEFDAPALFNAHCASCHGAQGQGKPGEAPEIQHTVPEYARWVVRNGRSDGSYLTEMPSFDEFLLPNTHLDAISSYLAELPKPTTGKTLFLDYCANCHGADATGGSVNRPIVGMADAFLETVRQGRNLDRVGARNMYMPSWKASALSDAEIVAIGEHVTLLGD